MQKLTTFIIALLLCALQVQAVENEAWSRKTAERAATELGVDEHLLLPTMPTFTSPERHSFWALRTVQVGTGLIGGGLVLSAADLQTRALRTDYLPNFRYHYDDYLQFAPLAVVAGLKAFGVEGRSSWERLLLSGGLSTGLMLSTVYVVKYGLGRLRPDGSTHNSFPSGHTAMAFTAATILHKEYGTTVSPWWSVAGYTMATVTGISRSLNNRHWLSDIVVGAGVGILATELGYWLTDKWLHSRGLIRPTDEWEPVRIGRNPSFVGIGIAHNALLYDSDRYERLTPSGIGFSLEGAWFINPHLGIGGAMKVGRYANLMERGAVPEGNAIDPQPLNNLSLLGGIYYNHPLGSGERLAWGAKVLAGVGRNHRLDSNFVDGEGNTVATVEYDRIEHFAATAGLHLRYIVADNLGVRLYADYNYIRADWQLHNATTDATSRHAAYHRPLSFGIAIDAMIW